MLGTPCDDLNAIHSRPVYPIHVACTTEDETVTLPTTVVTYKYDVHNQCVGRIRRSWQKWGYRQYTEEVTTRYYVDERGNRVVEGDNADLNCVKAYAPGADHPLTVDVRSDPSTTGPFGTIWVMADHQGTTHDLYRNNDEVEHVEYDPFGQPLLHPTLPASSLIWFVANFRAGREYDRTVDLYYNRARWHDANTGRFISEDPIGFANGDVNLYRYCVSVRRNTWGVWRRASRGSRDGLGSILRLASRDAAAA